MVPLEKPLEYLLEPLQQGRRRALQLSRRRRRVKVAAAAVAGAATVAGSAFAAITYLGEPAPPAVKKAFRANNAAKGAFEDARLYVPLVDVSTAETVAVSGSTVLYGAQGRSGNYCTVLLRNGRPARSPNVRCEFGVFPKAMRVDYKQTVSAGASVCAARLQRPPFGRGSHAHRAVRERADRPGACRVARLLRLPANLGASAVGEDRRGASRRARPAGNDHRHTGAAATDHPLRELSDLTAAVCRDGYSFVVPDMSRSHSMSS